MSGWYWGDMMRRFGITVCCHLLSACTIGVSADGSGVGSASPCTQDDDCPASMTCINGTCQTSNPALSHIILDVALPASVNLANYSGSAFVMPLDLPDTGVADILLPELMDLTLDANFQLVTDTSLGCPSPSPRVTMTHRWPIDGMEHAVYSVDALPATISAIPAGDDIYYEVYLELTTSDGDPACRLPPVLFRDVQSSTVLSWPKPQSISIDVQVPTAQVSAGSDLQNWQIDIVDPVDRRELAIPVQLGTVVLDSSDATTSHYPATIVYNPIASQLSPPAATEVLRLQPPAGAAYPTYYAPIANLSLFGASGEHVLALSGVPTPVNLSATVEIVDGLDPVQAQITLLSTGFLGGNDGFWADFRATTQSDAQGQFQVTLPAGQYRVLAAMANDAVHGVLDANWNIQASPESQAGRLLSIPLLSRLSGSLDFKAPWASSGPATIQATPTSELSYDKPTSISALRTVSLGARTSYELLDPGKSDFVLTTDSGQYDISLRPPDGSPWIVTSDFDVGEGSSVLGAWSQPLPLHWSGHLRIPAEGSAGNPNLTDIPRAVLRAFVLLDAQGSPTADIQSAQKIVQIAETRSGADGSFDLVLPDHIQVNGVPAS